MLPPCCGRLIAGLQRVLPCRDPQFQWMLSARRGILCGLSYHLSVPEASVGERVAFLVGARAQLGQLVTESVEKNASAIIEAINAAVTKLRERRGRYQLVVLSDMRQFTPEWDFEATVPQTPIFMTWLKKTHLLTDLRDIPVLVCGLHTRRSAGRGPFTASRAAQLQALWEQIFRGMGAPQLTIFTSCEAGLSV